MTMTTLSQSLTAALGAAQALESELESEKTERASLASQVAVLAGQVTALTDHVAALVAEIAMLRATWTPPVVVPPPVDPPAPGPASQFAPLITGEPQPADPLCMPDTGSGPDWMFSSVHLAIQWKHVNTGDWLDAAGREQGATPFASVSTPNAGARVTLDATSLVQRLLVTNTGIRLRGIGSSPVLICGGRLNAEPPRLLVTTKDGVFDCACLSSPAWTSQRTGTATQNSTQRLQFDNGNFHAGLRFDLSAVTGELVAAVLSLYVTSRFGPANSGIGLFELAQRPFVLGCGSATPQLGLAARVGEANLAGHPSVWMAGDFSGTVLKHEGVDGRAFVPKLFGRVNHHPANAPEIVEDPGAPGTMMWRGKFVPVTDRADPRRGAFDGTFLLMPGDDQHPLHPPQNVVEEAYYRMYIMLGDDFGTADDGNKMGLTWDLRMGYWKKSSSYAYWQNTTGNGGSRGDGRRYHEVREGAERYVYQGHMVRMECGQAAKGGPTPVSEYRPLLGYNYHIDQAGPFPGGPADPLGGVSYSSLIEAKIQKGRAVCLEQYIRMNSIDLSVVDAQGNGEARADGVIKTWVNAVQTDERTGYRWRRHPEMGICGVNANWYLGGAVPTTKPMTWSMNHLVLAREYIGPRVN